MWRKLLACIPARSATCQVAPQFLYRINFLMFSSCVFRDDTKVPDYEHKKPSGYSLFRMAYWDPIASNEIITDMSS